MVQRQLWMLVGGNGSGKSTFYSTRLAPLGLPFVNADVIARELFPDSPEQHSYEAARTAEEIRNALLLEGRSFCFETVFSHPSKIDFVARAKTLGYQVILVFIHLQQPSLNKARVFQRVKQGGHNVPNEKVEQRIPRLLENVKKVIPLCDQVRVLDNSVVENPFQQVAVVRNGQVTEHIVPLPDWACYVLQ
ncbi:MAG: dephospho-CoA kinase [Pseudomonadales bacterium]|nr:dephospho-CoA kinase [Pseudomonadales bacterium]